MAQIRITFVMYIIINSRTGLRAKQNTTSRFNIYINKRISQQCSHLGQWAGPPDTILEEEHPMTMLSKFGSNSCLKPFAQ
jgi:hypothetical protein